MGMQSAAAHTIGIPGITTTYFTGTMTNIVVDAVGRTVPRESASVAPHRRMRWPVGAFISYVTGAAITGFLLSHTDTFPIVGVAALPVIALTLVLGSVTYNARRFKNS